MASKGRLWWVDLIPEPARSRRLYMRVLEDEVWTERKDILGWQLRLRQYKRQGRLTPAMEERIQERIRECRGRKRRAERELAEIVRREEPLWREWGRLVPGLTPHALGRIIAIIYTPLRFEHVSQLWAYVNDCVEPRTQYSRRLKSVLWDIVQSFIYQGHPFYYALYNWAKERELKKGVPRWRADRRARRIVRKVFVAHLFEVWTPLDAKLAGVSVSEERLMPYSVAYLNHRWVRASEATRWDGSRDIAEVLGEP